MNFWDDLMETDENASEYMTSYGEGPGCPTRFTLGEFINDGETVLDVGCGPGHNYEHFRDYGPQVTYKGLDYAIRFIRADKIKYPEANFALGDVRDMPEENESWDVVIMQDALEHTNGYEKPITEALRVSRKRVLITFWHLADSDSPHINDDGNDGWGAWYDKREWEAYLNTLPYIWLHHEIEYPAGRQRDYYIIDKEVHSA